MQSVPSKLVLGAKIQSGEYNDQHITIMGTKVIASVGTFHSTILFFFIVKIMYLRNRSWKIYAIS